jgi:hypothetical protein
MKYMMRFKLILFLLMYALFVLLSSGYVDSQDGLQYLTIARQMYHQRTLEMPEGSYPQDNIHMNINIGIDGKKYSPTGIGFSASLLPAVFIEDILLKITNKSPEYYFPLKNDWPVLFAASITNAFWAALFVVGLYTYLKNIEIKHKEAKYLSIVLFLGSNLVVHSKHVFAHMMFVTSLLYIFLFIKLAKNTSKHMYYILSGFAFSVLVISYNPTFFLIIPIIPIFYLLVNKFTIKANDVKKLVFDSLLFLLGSIPLLSLYFYVNNFRFGGILKSGYSSSSIPIPPLPPAFVIVEGIWSLLFSPGKSIFLFTPILLLLLFFAYKIKIKLIPELISGIVLFLLHLWTFGSFLGGPDFLVWHGDSSWGPRYLLPILPFFLIIIAHIYVQLNTIQKKLVFLPLLLIGIYVNFLGVVLPYQIRFYGLESEYKLNGYRFHVSDYGNIIPRFSPVFNMSKRLYYRIHDLPKLYGNGDFNLRLVDGFGYPYIIDETSWRGLKDTAVFSFEGNGVNSISFNIYNHYIDASRSAQILIINEDKSIYNTSIESGSSKIITINFDNNILNKSTIKLKSSFEGESINEFSKHQVLFLKDVQINNNIQNISKLDYPYVSEISKSINPSINYEFYGSNDSDKWDIWHMHSGIYEQTFDFWWLRPIHFWDLPKKIFFTLFLTNVFSVIILSVLLNKYDG